MKIAHTQSSQASLFSTLPPHRRTLQLSGNRTLLADENIFDSPEWRAIEIQNIIQDPRNRIFLPLFQLSWIALVEGESLDDLTDSFTPLSQKVRAAFTSDPELYEKMRWFVRMAYISIDLAHSTAPDEKARIKSQYLAPFLTKQDADELLLTCARVLVKKEFSLKEGPNGEMDITQANASHLAAIIHRFADMEVWHRGHLNSRSIRKRSDSAVLFFASWLWRNTHDYQLSKSGEDINLPVIFACLAEAYRQVQKINIPSEGIFDSDKYTLIPGAGSFSEQRAINEARLAHAYRDQFPNHWNDHLAYVAGESRKKASTVLEKAA